MSAASNLVLITGAESFLVERALGGELSAARSREPQVERRDVDAAEPGALGALQEACSPTLFGSGSVVVVSGVESATADFVGALIAQSRQSGVPLIVIHPAGAKGKKQLGELKAAAARIVECDEIKRGRGIQDFVVAEFAAHNRRISGPGLSLLVAAVGSDPRELATACSQLCSDIEQGDIDVDDVARYFGGTVEVTGFQISDAVLNRDRAQAIRLMRLAEGADGGGRLGPATIASLVNGVRQLVAVATAPAELGEREIAARAKVPPWKVRTLNQQLRRWSQRDLAAAILLLADLDAAMKGGLREGEQLDPAQKGLLLERSVARLASK